MTPALKTTDTAVLTAFAAQVEALQEAPVLRPNDHLAAWRAAYASEGLPVGKSRQEAESLRRLEAVGLVTAGPGATMGRKFKLTLAGAVNAATRFEKNDADHLRKMLTDVLTCLDATDTTVPRSDVPILLGCEVVESAGGWWELASKSDENWRNYQNDLARANGWLWPLLALGYLDRLASVDGRIWGLVATAAGRESAFADWPEPPPLPPLSEDEAYSVWNSAYGDALARYSTPGPAAFQSVVERHLPASRWY
jgi:hypothetical protein